MGSLGKGKSSETERKFYDCTEFTIEYLTEDEEREGIKDKNWGIRIGKQAECAHRGVQEETEAPATDKQVAGHCISLVVPCALSPQSVLYSY